MLAALLASAPAARAQSPFGFDAGLDDGPALIDAGQIVYERERDVVIAEGGVTVVQGARALSAERIEYFRAEDRILATGGVTIIGPDGETARAERAELSAGLKRAVAENLGLTLKDGSRLVGRRVERTAGVGATLQDGAFTPCALCAEDPDRPPLWRLRARKVVHDEVDKTIEYDDVTLDVAGLPVAYLPYFSHPDPTVSRRTGLLAPTLYLGGEFDAFAQLPFFWEIAPNEDLTLKPIVTLRSAPVAAAEYRRLFENGRIRFDGSLGVLDRTTNGGREQDDELRGHAFVDGAFVLDETWRFSFDGRTASDDSYLETFKIEDADVLRSTAAFEGFWREDYVRVGGYFGQDLRELADQNDTPFALPEARASFLGTPGPYGYGFFEGDARVLGRDQGTTGESASAKAGWRAPLYAPGGHRFDLETSLRGDIYNTRDGNEIGAVGEDATSRGVASFAAGWRYPLIQQNDWGALIIEPRAQLVANLDQGGDENIPNEDSRAIEYDESNFFDIDRFPGRDLVDDSQRVDYGVTATALFDRGGQATAFLGHSMSRRRNGFARAAGMGRASDVVAALSAAPAPWLDLAYRVRLAREDLQVRRQEISIGAGPDWLRGEARYTEIDAEAQGPEESLAAQQLKLGLAVRFADYWGARVSHHTDLDAGRSLYWSAAIGYQDECLMVDLGYERDFASQADGGGREDSIILRVSFKHLGGLGIRQGLGVRDEERPE